MTKITDSNEPTKAQISRWNNQEKKVFAAFYQEPRTMYQVAKLTGVDRANVCRFVSVWKRKDTIRVVKTDKDPYTRCTAQFLSTNPIHWPKSEPKPERELVILRNGQTSLFQ